MLNRGQIEEFAERGFLLLPRVWPGTHLTHAEYFRENGPDAFFAAGGYPPIELPEPEQVTGQRGDLLLARYLLGHNIGGNTSQVVRRGVLPGQAGRARSPLA